MQRNYLRGGDIRNTQANEYTEMVAEKAREKRIPGLKSLLKFGSCWVILRMLYFCLQGRVDSYYWDHPITTKRGDEHLKGLNQRRRSHEEFGFWIV